MKKIDTTSLLLIGGAAALGLYFMNGKKANAAPQPQPYQPPVVQPPAQPPVQTPVPVIPVPQQPAPTQPPVTPPPPPKGRVVALVPTSQQASGGRLSWRVRITNDGGPGWLWISAGLGQYQGGDHETGFRWWASTPEKTNGRLWAQAPPGANHEFDSIRHNIRIYLTPGQTMDVPFQSGPTLSFADYPYGRVDMRVLIGQFQEPAAWQVDDREFDIFQSVVRR